MSREQDVEPSTRIGVRKTYKLYLDGAFPRSESGRSYVVTDTSGQFLANAAMASRKDLRDAVVAARNALSGWSGATAYNRGQVLYRVAEMLEDRRDQFIDAICDSEPVGRDESTVFVDSSIDRWIWYAGWSDKLAQVAGSTNPVAGPFFNFSLPEPTGVIGVVAPQCSSLLGLVSVLAPIIVTGNTAVVIASELRPVPALCLAEVLIGSDVPHGVVNLLTGKTMELAPVLAAHRDVDALDLTGVPRESAGELEVAAATNVKRVVGPPTQEPDWTLPATPRSMLRFVETKTVWHPIGQ